MVLPVTLTVVRLLLCGGLHRRATGGERRLQRFGIHTLFRKGGAVVFDELHELWHSAQEARRLDVFTGHVLSMDWRAVRPGFATASRRILLRLSL